MTNYDETIDHDLAVHQAREEAHDAAAGAALLTAERELLAELAEDNSDVFGLLADQQCSNHEIEAADRIFRLMAAGETNERIGAELRVNFDRMVTKAAAIRAGVRA